MKKLTNLFIVLIGFFSCTPQNKKTVQIEKNSYGITQEGQEVDRYTLSNAAGMQVEIITSTKLFFLSLFSQLFSQSFIDGI